MRGKVIGAALLAALALAVVPCAADDKGGTIKLFNGKDLSGWKMFSDPTNSIPPEQVWSVKDGVIVCKGFPLGYLITEKEYGDYMLTLEWRWAPKGDNDKRNSGVFVHVSGPDKIWPKGVEAQLYRDHAGDIWLVDGFKLDVDKARQDPKQARHFFKIDREKKIEKPIGEWNKYEITCKGDTIKLVVNGHSENEGKNAEQTKGKILLQSEGAEIHFRNIELTPVK